jgi:hypothetical protein
MSLLKSDAPSEIPTPDVHREIPSSYVLPEIPTSSVPPHISISDTPPPIRPSELSPEIPRFHHLPPKIPPSDLHVRSEIPRSQSPPEIAPSDVIRAELSTSEIQNGYLANGSTYVFRSPALESRTGIRKPLSYQTGSFSGTSSPGLDHTHLKYTFSSPAIPYLPAKYSPRTRSPSDGSDVRWYFCKTPLRQDGEFYFNF